MGIKNHPFVICIYIYIGGWLSSHPYTSRMKKNQVWSVSPLAPPPLWNQSFGFGCLTNAIWPTQQFWKADWFMETTRSDPQLLVTMVKIVYIYSFSHYVYAYTYIYICNCNKKLPLSPCGGCSRRQRHTLLWYSSQDARHADQASPASRPSLWAQPFPWLSARPLVMRASWPRGA